VATTPDWISVIDGGKRLTYWTGGAVGVGERRTVGCVRRGGSIVVASQIIRDVETNRGLARGAGSTWRDLCDAWIDEHRGVLPEGTFRTRRSSINSRILPRVGSVLLGDTGLATMLAVLDPMAKEGLVRSTLEGARDALSVVAEWGAARNWLPAQPFGPDAPRTKAVKRVLDQCPASKGQSHDDGDGDTDRGVSTKNSPTWAEVCELADAWADYMGGVSKSRETGELHGATLRVAAASGLRMCELLGLTVPHVHLDAGTMHVAWQLNRYVAWKFGAPMPTVPPKHSKPKQNVIRSRTAAVWEKVRPDLEALVAAGVARGDGLIVPRIANNTWQADAWSRKLYEVRTNIGWRWSTHWLRHHYGSYTCAPIEQGGLGRSFPELQTWMGHLKLSTTLDVYSHPVTDTTVGWL